MGYKFNPFTGSFDTVDSPNGVFQAIKVNGDVNLDDGGTYTTTLQTITPTANRTISLPDATGTVALVAGSSGQLLYNNAGVNAGASTLTYDGSILTTSGRFINSYNATASAPAKAFTGTWFTGGTGTTTKPHLLIEPTGTTSTSWFTFGTGIGVNAASGFAGRHLDLQTNGTTLLSCGADGSSYRLRTAGGVLSTGAGVQFDSVGNGGIRLNSDRPLGWSNANSTDSGGQDTQLWRDSASVIGQRFGTNAQTFRVYNTYTDASNYERGFLRWSSNVFEVGPEAAGTGAARPMRITAATLKLPNLPTYATNAAAITGGLVAGDVYKTSTGELRITV
jgi:hypothetical protein